MKRLGRIGTAVTVVVALSLVGAGLTTIERTSSRELKDAQSVLLKKAKKKAPSKLQTRAPRKPAKVKKPTLAQKVRPKTRPQVKPTVPLALPVPAAVQTPPNADLYGALSALNQAGNGPSAEAAVRQTNNVVMSRVTVAQNPITDFLCLLFCLPLQLLRLLFPFLGFLIDPLLILLGRPPSG